MKKRVLALGIAAVLGINGAAAAPVLAAKKDKVEITNVWQKLYYTAHTALL